MKKIYFIKFTLLMSMLALTVLIFGQISDKKVIIVGALDRNVNPPIIRPEDQVLIDSVSQWVDATFLDAAIFNNAPKDSLYTTIGAEGVIISESIGGGAVGNFGQLRDQFPKPCIIFEAAVFTDDAATTDKWLLLETGGGTWGYGSPKAVDVQWKIIDNTHYITQEFDLGVVNYAAEPNRGVPYLHDISYNPKILAVAAREADDVGGSNSTYTQDKAIAIGLIEARNILFINVAYTYFAAEGTENLYKLLHRAVEFMFDAYPPEPVAINENLLSKIELTAFPNPASDEVTIRFKASEIGNATATIFDVTGKAITTLNKKTVLGNNYFFHDVSNYPRGLYVVKVQAGNHTEYTKMVIQ